MHALLHLHALLLLKCLLCSCIVHTRLLAAHDLGGLLARDDTRRLPTASTAHELIVLLLAPHLGRS